MTSFFKLLSISGLLVLGLVASGVPVGAISEKTTKLSKEMIDVSNRAEENLKEAKKALEEAVEEYFAALRLLGIDEPTREVGVRIGTTAYKGVQKKYKEIIKKDIDETYKKAVDNNKARKDVYSKNISSDSNKTKDAKRYR